MAPNSSLEKPIGSVLRAVEDKDMQYIPTGCEMMNRTKAKYVLIGSAVVLHSSNPLFRGSDGHARAYMYPLRKTSSDGTSWTVKIVAFEILISLECIESKEIPLPATHTIHWLMPYMEKEYFQTGGHSRKWTQLEQSIAHKEYLLYLWEQVTGSQLQDSLKAKTSAAEAAHSKDPNVNQDDDEEEPDPVKVEGFRSRQLLNKRKRADSPSSRQPQKRIAEMEAADDSSEDEAFPGMAINSTRPALSLQKERNSTDRPATSSSTPKVSKRTKRIEEDQAGTSSSTSELPQSQSEHIKIHGPFEHSRLEMPIYGPSRHPNSRVDVSRSPLETRKDAARRQWARFNTGQGFFADEHLTAAAKGWSLISGRGVEPNTDLMRSVLTELEACQSVKKPKAEEMPAWVTWIAGLGMGSVSNERAAKLAVVDLTNSKVPTTYLEAKAIMRRAEDLHITPMRFAWHCQVIRDARKLIRYETNATKKLDAPFSAKAGKRIAAGTGSR